MVTQALGTWHTVNAKIVRIAGYDCLATCNLVFEQHLHCLPYECTKQEPKVCDPGLELRRMCAQVVDVKQNKVRMSDSMQLAAAM